MGQRRVEDVKGCKRLSSMRNPLLERGREGEGAREGKTFRERKGEKRSHIISFLTQSQ